MMKRIFEKFSAIFGEDLETALPPTSGRFSSRWMPTRGRRYIDSTIFLRKTLFFSLVAILSLTLACQQAPQNTAPEKEDLNAKDLLGNPEYQAISYGGYRQNTRDVQPTIEELKEDMKILDAMGIHMLRTYNVEFDHAANVLEAIDQLNGEDPDFEMYVMLGAWIDCENAFTASPNHEAEDTAKNAAEIERAVKLAQKYPDIVKIIAVGNEAMVKWAATYFVQADVILKWVNHLQDLKKAGELPQELWVTSSDNFASWGGGGGEYHTEDLEKLIRAVDYVSMHTYPMHDTHYNPDFWGISTEEKELDELERIDRSIDRALAYAQTQYQNVAKYLENLGIDKPIHIGETGWASSSNGHYGPEGSKATDEYKEALYYNKMRAWTQEKNIACFFFEAFDENWKDAKNPGGSENHFGLFTLDGQAKYVLWERVDQGVFEGLGRGGKEITKTYEGNKEALMKEVLLPPEKDLISLMK